ncbi:MULTISPECIES: tyrosine-protein phosphatase [Clostridium]|uniref:protein-tyrosine-phosphatase n=1 Tax=Clostridium lapidicellarium TaxID=3240931 RepID=A0ABV4DZN1_9CLOT|nr:CpsB/CapC family capsule biosynthesis tyrosine phosphatase [uncultured Clostridium sp.]NLU08271.1 exopolysaccharide biosynthesis protein [Clostridiales bacterium]
MVDIHSHILPGIDDGSKSMEQTVKMLKLTEADGVKTIAATSHFYRGYYENSCSDIKKLVEKVKAEAERENINVDIVPGQEVMLDRYSLEYYKSGRIGCIGNTDYMLVEFPMIDMPEDAMDIIYELQIRGVHPILAHPERYRYIIGNPSKINEFLNEGCLLQVNTGSIKGIFGKKVKNTARILIKSGISSFIASDAHSMGGRRPGISTAIEMASEIDRGICGRVEKNCEKLLENQLIDPPDNRIKEKKRIFSFFRA